MNKNIVPRPLRNFEHSAPSIINIAEYDERGILRVDTPGWAIENANLGVDIMTLLPKGYSVAGGAARNILLSALGEQVEMPPRDIDIIFAEAEEERLGAMSELDITKVASPRDAEHGHGVQTVDSIADYMKSGISHLARSYGVMGGFM